MLPRLHQVRDRCAEPSGCVGTLLHYCKKKKPTKRNTCCACAQFMLGCSVCLPVFSLLRKSIATHVPYYRALRLQPCPPGIQAVRWKLLPAFIGHTGTVQWKLQCGISGRMKAVSIRRKAQRTTASLWGGQ